jgi:hypothetical protein
MCDLDDEAAAAGHSASIALKYSPKKLSETIREGRFEAADSF